MDRVSAPPIEVPTDMKERMRFAEESVRMVDELWGYAVPWHIIKWWKLNRLIRARNDALEAANAKTRAELAQKRAELAAR